MFKGCGTALITPFKDGKVDYRALENILEFQVQGKADALIVLGTTGEASTISADDKKDIISFSVEKVNHRIPVIIGTGANDTAAAVANSKKAEALGADGILVVTPYYNKCTQKGLVAHYKAISDQVGIPIIAYSVPSRTGVNILPETALRLAEVKNVCGIKEASGNISQITDIARLTSGKLSLFSGDDGITVPVMAAGGVGVISVASNFLPSFVHEMTAKCLGGDFKEAIKMQYKLNPLVSALFCEVNPIPVKKAMALLGFCKNEIRMPLTEMEEETTLKLQKAMRDFGLNV